MTKSTPPGTVAWEADGGGWGEGGVRGNMISLLCCAVTEGIDWVTLGTVLTQAGLTEY